jgi:predicted metal-dependent HD superfamily phosphohydrolase
MENSIEYVKEKWKKLTSFSKKEELKEQMWEEIVYRYSGQHRHYHNLNHIAHLFTLLDKYIDKITNPAVIGFAILYHDVVYDTYSIDNEEQSAVFAEAHLRQLNVNNSVIDNVKTFIKATKDHIIPEGVSLQNDLSFFLDFDMAILGEEEEMYKLYSEKIREEYSKYADPFYKEGRKLALQKIFTTKSIFATSVFREEMEQKAHQNINRELNLL